LSPICPAWYFGGDRIPVRAETRVWPWRHFLERIAWSSPFDGLWYLTPHRCVLPGTYLRGSPKPHESMLSCCVPGRFGASTGRAHSSLNRGAQCVSREQ
jgi:hypothetical protein